MDTFICDRSRMAYTDKSLNTSTVYLQDFRSEPCQVCGENASGWHCGSITCEACKKFFLRSVNGEYIKYKCMKDKNCIITRTTRTQCQYCRYSKCISTGMKITEENSNPKIEEIFKEIPCAVCDAASSGIHFGTTTCEGCKGFFRRMIKERIPQHYKCSERNNCVINFETRNMCRACRYRKCLMAGMSMEGSRIGRQSNLFKHKMIEMQRRGLIQSQLFNILTSNLNNSRRKTTLSNQESTVVLLESHVFQQISEIENAYINHLKNLPIFLNEGNDLRMACISQLNAYYNHVRDFIEQISSFNSLNIEHKTSLIHSSTPSIILMCFCIQSSNSNWNYLNIPLNSSLIPYFQDQYSFFFELNRLTNSFQIELEKLNLDDKEISLMLILLLTSKLENNRLDSIEEEFFSILYDYMSHKRGIDSKDYFLLTIQIPFLHRINNCLSSNIKDSL